MGLGWGPRIFVSREFPGDADANAAGPRTTAEDHYEKLGVRRTVRDQRRQFHSWPKWGSILMGKNWGEVRRGWGPLCSGSRLAFFRPFSRFRFGNYSTGLGQVRFSKRVLTSPHLLMGRGVFLSLLVHLPVWLTDARLPSPLSLAYLGVFFLDVFLIYFKL